MQKQPMKQQNPEPKTFPKKCSGALSEKECRWEQYHPHKVSVILHTTTQRPNLNVDNVPF
jgi:hypothetical protein